MNNYEKKVVRSSIMNSFNAINDANILAKKRDDIEALIVISDRWIALAEKVRSLDMGGAHKLGFIIEEEGDESVREFNLHYGGEQ